MEKKLGLQKHYKKMSRQEKFKMIEEKQEHAKIIKQETRERIKISIQEQNDKKESDIISSMSEFISKNKNIPLIDAMVIAKEQYINSTIKK